MFTNLQKDRLVSFMRNMDNLMQSSDARSKFFRSAPESHYTLKGLIRNLDSPLRCALYDLTTFEYVNELVDCSLWDALGFLVGRNEIHLLFLRLK